MTYCGRIGKAGRAFVCVCTGEQMECELCSERGGRKDNRLWLMLRIITTVWSLT